MDKKIVHVATDIETMSLRPNAIVVSAGLVAFTAQGGLVRQGAFTFNAQQQASMGRDIMESTTKWWEEQPPEVAEQLVRAHDCRTPVADTLRHIRDWFGAFNRGHYRLAGVWGYGSDFDNVILQGLAFDAKAEPLWHYRANRCGRTLLSFFPEVKIPQVGNKHNALDDARWLAESVRACLIKMGKQGIPV